MKIEGVHLFGEFDVFHYYHEMFLHLMVFYLVLCFFNTQNDLVFWLLLSKVIERLLNEFSDLYSEFIEPPPDFICSDDHNLIGFITSRGDTWELVEWNRMPEKMLESFVPRWKHYVIIFKR